MNTRIEYGPRGAEILVTKCKDCKADIRRFASMVGDGRYLRCPKCYGKRPRCTWHGYPVIWVDGRYMMTHRHIMEKHLKRKLRPGEMVHHKNEDISDFRLSNLQVMTHKQHRQHHAHTIWNVEDAKKLFAEGFSFRAIGRRLGMDAMPIYNYFVAHGLYVKGSRKNSHKGPSPS